MGTRFDPDSADSFIFPIHGWHQGLGVAVGKERYYQPKFMEFYKVAARGLELISKLVGIIGAKSLPQRIERLGAGSRTQRSRVRRLD